MAENSSTYETGYAPMGSGAEAGSPNLKGKVAGAASAVKDKAVSIGHQAADQIDAKRGSAAGKLESAAALFHEKADSLPGGAKVQHAVHATAGGLQSTAGYLRQHDTEAMLSDAGSLVGRNPGPALLVAAGLGFLVGRAFRRR